MFIFFAIDCFRLNKKTPKLALERLTIFYNGHMSPYKKESVFFIC
ncbi:hypothetical protein DB29_00134 [Shouchella clausii]|nr:hypothetical protein DB29_00134 [Shouchella clausii]